MSSNEPPQHTIPADHLPSLLGASLDACVILRFPNDQLSIVGGNELWSDMCGTPMRDLIRRTPSSCMSSELVAMIERRIADGLPDHISAIPDGPEHLVGPTEAQVSLLPIAPTNGQAFVMVTARSVGAPLVEPEHVSILQALGEGVIRIDRDLRIQYANPATQRLLGYRPDQLADTDIRSLACDDSVTTLSGHLASTSAIPSSVRLTLRSADGADVILEATTTLIRDPEPSVIMALHDLAHQQEHEEALAGLSAVDTLTGLANRDTFSEHLRTLAESSDERTLVVAFLDLDNFKTGAYCDEIKNLQDESEDMTVKLRNRRDAEGRLKSFLDNVVLPPDLATCICGGEVNDAYLEYVVMLNSKLTYVSQVRG